MKKPLIGILAWMFAGIVITIIAGLIFRSCSSSTANQSRAKTEQLKTKSEEITAVANNKTDSTLQTALKDGKKAAKLVREAKRDRVVITTADTLDAAMQIINYEFKENR